jgi:hypothetical protein
MERIFIKKYFLFRLGSVCRVHNGVERRGKSFADEEEVVADDRRRKERGEP